MDYLDENREMLITTITQMAGDIIALIRDKRATVKQMTFTSHVLECALYNQIHKFDPTLLIYTLGETIETIANYDHIQHWFPDDILIDGEDYHLTYKDLRRASDAIDEIREAAQELKGINLIKGSLDDEYNEG